MHNEDEYRVAFAKADAILALEGYVPTPAIAELQEAVISGKLTFDEAVAAVINDATKGRGGTATK